MSQPVPLKKIDELVLLLTELKPAEILSEFKYARCNRLLNEAKSITPEDWWLMCKSLVELYANNLIVADKLANEIFLNSNDLKVLRNLHYIFNQTFNYVKAVEVNEKIINISRKLNLELRETLPTWIELEFFLSGNIDKSDLFKHDHEIHKVFLHLKLIQDELEISKTSLIAILEIVHNIILNSGSKCQSVEYSYIEEEFLVTVFIDKDFKTISDLNKLLARKCYASGLLDELNKVSYLFLPFDESVDE
ncbi:hypothetical protein [Acinetobacter sp. Leaf130]|uniref:hypothetical protein n=1 Tax=Acinetobacter sp. Leaf130 TaxID=1736269 RepID=UPI0006FCD2E1|nr:hypothetical protein [Acinetobacter sp. Leaf130]KQQ77221.1 hypothetical protein ASF86_06865 [Acinetobacter sp. Leaf130]